MQFVEKFTKLLALRPDLSRGQSAQSKTLCYLELFLKFVFAVFALNYAYELWNALSPYWFHPKWSTDDALQQVYPFHKVLHPNLFKGDLITEVMEGYLAPLHYWICYVLTWLTGDVIMMSHWVMLIQIVLTGVFTFAAIQYLAGFAPACFALTWYLHTRNIIQRQTAGLPRGWAAVVIVAFLYFLLKRDQRSVLVVLFLGCLLHPPATLLVAACYGMTLLWGLSWRESRSENIKPFRNLLLFTPVFIILTLLVIQRPEHLGQMVSYQEAAQMPEFQWPDGRFPFVPLRGAWYEIRSFGFQAFITSLFNPGRFWRLVTVPLVLSMLALLGLFAVVKKRKIIPAELWFFLGASLLIYFASRLLAFKLYVPNRHLQFPLAFFLIFAITVGCWRIFSALEIKNQLLKLILPYVALVLLGLFVYHASGDGMQGTANFNYAFNKKGAIWGWMRSQTPENSLIAGHPSFIDATQLFGTRQAFATTETAHPFYPGYYAEIHRRLVISLKAHYAKSFEELLLLLEPEGVTHFVFERKRFYPQELKQAKYFPPLNEMVKELTSGSTEAYAYKLLPTVVDSQKAPYMPFRDQQSAVVDLKLLRSFLEHQKGKSTV